MRWLAAVGLCPFGAILAYQYNLCFTFIVCLYTWMIVSLVYMLLALCLASGCWLYTEEFS